MTLRVLLTFMMIAAAGSGQQAKTYAERLGWQKGDRVLILHIDDAGMSYESNAAVQQVVEKGAAPSLSVMMPCPWVPQMVRFIKANPRADAGVHLTLTSEWVDYRWAPVAGAPAVPGLVDVEGAMWRSVKNVAAHATPDEVDREIRAQLDRAEKMGFHPTHLDSHMGTLFESPAFLEKYIRLGVEKQIPVMVPGGHCSYLRTEYRKGGDELLAAMQALGERVWQAGLPVLDDLHGNSYSWKPPAGIAGDDAKLQAWRTGRYIESLKQLKPGLTQVILHCTAASDVFGKISDSSDVRKADMLAMLDPALMAFLREQGFIVTTWREIAERRRRAK